MERYEFYRGQRVHVPRNRTTGYPFSDGRPLEMYRQSMVNVPQACIVRDLTSEVTRYHVVPHEWLKPLEVLDHDPNDQAVT